MPFWWDDWMSFAATAISIAFSINTFLGMIPNGYGRDMWAVQPDNITKFFKGYYTSSAMYLGARSFTRASILLFYLRIFTIKEARRKILYTLLIEVIVSLAYIFTMMFQCTPISFYWTKWDRQHNGHCIDWYQSMLIGWSILIAIDLWVMWLPLPMVANLNLSMKKKLLISVMFAMGIVVTAIGIVRLPMVYGATHTKNATYDLVQMNKYCQIEVDLGVICSCMPSLPALFRPLGKRLFGKHKLPTTKGPGYMTPWSRRNQTGDIKTSATTMAASYPGPPRGAQHAACDGHTSPRPDQIQAVTTIDQTYWRNDSDDPILNGADIELGGADGYVRSQAWADGPGAGAFGGPRQPEQKGDSW